MNVLGLSALAVALAAGTSLVTTLAISSPEASPRVDAAAPEELALLRDEVRQLRLELSQVREAASSATELRPSPEVGSNRLAIGDIEAEVERLFEERLATALAEGLVASSAEGVEAEPRRTAEEFYGLLTASDLSPEGGQALWDEAREAGHLDALVAMFEARAEEFSNDPDAQLDVGHAYLQKIFEVGDGPAAGLWAGRADASFDRALAIDDHHWQARSSKAISLSFWPPIFGKQKDAIEHFEILIGQQEAGPVQDNYSQTYLLLGNLYSQTGQGEKASAIWQQGSTLFPEDEALSEALGGNSNL